MRVHPDILRGEALPAELLNEKTIWEERYRSINDLESHLYRNGTRILKFFLHVSKEEQRKRFLARLDDPDKNWKFSAGDLAERALWEEYMVAYQECLRATSTKEAPWYVIPADDKKNARLLIAEAIVETLKGMKMSYPQSRSGASQRAANRSGARWPMRSHNRRSQSSSSRAGEARRRLRRKVDAVIP